MSSDQSREKTSTRSMMSSGAPTSWCSIRAISFSFRRSLRAISIPVFGQRRPRRCSVKARLPMMLRCDRSKKELNIEGVTPTELGEHFFVYPDGVKRRKTTYFRAVDQAPTPNPADIAELRAWNRADLESTIRSTPEIFAPTFLGIWEQYSSSLPF